MRRTILAAFMLMIGVSAHAQFFWWTEIEMIPESKLATYEFSEAVIWDYDMAGKIELGIGFRWGSLTIQGAPMISWWWFAEQPHTGWPHRFTGWISVEYEWGPVTLGAHHSSTHPVAPWAPMVLDDELLAPGFDSYYNSVYLRISS